MRKKCLLSVAGGLVQLGIELVLLVSEVFQAAAAFPVLFLLCFWLLDCSGSFGLREACFVLPLRSLLLGVVVEGAVFFLLVPAAVVQFAGPL